MQSKFAWSLSHESRWQLLIIIMTKSWLRYCEKAIGARIMTHFKTNLNVAKCANAVCTPKIFAIQRWGFEWNWTAMKIILTPGTRLCWSAGFLLCLDHQNTLNHRPSSLGPSHQIYSLPYHWERSKCSKVLQFELCPLAVESEINFKVE